MQNCGRIPANTWHFYYFFRLRRDVSFSYASHVPGFNIRTHCCSWAILGGGVTLQHFLKLAASCELDKVMSLEHHVLPQSYT